MSFRTIEAARAALLDQELMSTMGFTIDQLMELAGLAVAQAIYKEYPPSSTKNCLILCGPGNNGGDGLVAARHLKLFGYAPKVYYPKPTNREIFTGLTTQLRNFNVPFVSDLTPELKSCDLIVDALFGFSFKPPIRKPFDAVIESMLQAQKNKKKIIAVDIPSGWDVDEGPVAKEISDYQPDLLVSLTAPKPCAKLLKKGALHYVGGRFIDKTFAEKWNIDVPDYPGIDQCAKID
ncbi:hypothetical protein KL918_000174 [Ogataea parapolymorpha]|uniref:NAD(P)H-hydrate epimerase n=1 Tax=Ogataea parapolymorpha (strain ATCC 26012 / BCRC 20466 / JCM 22074 / NRRL Y-7560 / DL-1) TaxID=871575 RepID=W1QA21_OGAPD|nr:NAD(P)H-hydrate epimerase [Ogataea parapolymorpha DL-1]ESW96225.1 NAD(P)H-hydrate epimerase [Ogataea parapolymorpha DL-1]KAG7869970.1 hypothetical protein KL918_000174 [Ogataea parapolymorpha]KAG7873258.1 hypothetical protein KL916_002559 [Ogataea parapolymorpha]KAG7884867.1 hypothetical protein KL938_001124 [Ogataea parapolymorpha]